MLYGEEREKKRHETTTDADGVIGAAERSVRFRRGIAVVRLGFFTNYRFQFLYDRFVSIVILFR